MQPALAVTIAALPAMALALVLALLLAAQLIIEFFQGLRVSAKMVFMIMELPLVRPAI